MIRQLEVIGKRLKHCHGLFLIQLLAKFIHPILNTGRISETHIDVALFIRGTEEFQ